MPVLFQALPLALLIEACAGLPGTQWVGSGPEYEVEIIAAGISYLRPRISERAARPDAVIVFDPTLVEDIYGGGPQDPGRAGKVAEKVDVQIRTLREARDCPANAPCQLKADVLFRFGRPVIAGDTATVKVAFWWAGRPEWRDPMPMRVAELTLARSDRAWIVIDDRTLMVSGITPLTPPRQGLLAGSLSSESDSA